MLELVTIFTRGGVVLWSRQSGAVAVSPTVINALISSAFIEKRAVSDKQFVHDHFALKWAIVNELDLVFVVVHQKALQLNYVDELLSSMATSFVNTNGDDVRAFAAGLPLFKPSGKHVVDFDARFDTIWEGVMQRYEESLRIPKAMKSFEESKKAQKSGIASPEPKSPSASIVTSPTTSQPVSPTAASSGNSAFAPDSDTADRLKKLGIQSRSAGSASKSKPSPSASTESKAPPKKKKATAWDPISGGMMTNAHSGPLDFSSDKPGTAAAAAPDMSTYTAGLERDSLKGDLPDIEYTPREQDDDANEEETADEAPVTSPGKAPILATPSLNGAAAPVAKKAGFGSGLLSFFQGLSGNKVLTAEDLAATLEKTKEHLINKNVAADISEKLCDSVRTNLVGKTMPSFTTITSTVTKSLEEAVTSILSPNRRVDILRDVLAKRQDPSGRPFTIVFCGVNGVGKSTNLAKICYWLVQNDISILIAACDTFRAGAVEQLRVHTRCLNDLQRSNGKLGPNDPDSVMLYEKGYGKDAAAIAFDAVNYGRDQRRDVVLVDTAGRMQDNEPLMRSLAKLVKTNEPDLVLFVGEALVGNEAVDQLKRFNQSLADFSESTNPHLIDGIVLTKFDTIDDKVGAAISMTYTSGQPIVFVGTGQTYRDLKKLNVKSVVQALLSN
ncbi:GTP-binding protein-PA [Capsaspora owczarzaki ATCC 30864]|uniref:GTP-binding protein-PA n=1 Tax=Capsaspora owczarzaki (strain ATCC 30864) TaxID=595528 RepID=A0A0D2WHZ5_CAPO3|nr:GTP-binding protein-PA [Capsaspora owczarzaki ATCC 30864]KJE89365.1 GTP-binding protein-PA [Capsaspora owczarzaki ATCC 30864]|eukprot:XP_004365719.2 GTP-binding protein-PA [Capsaspora owczarzaki ATCC 30864]